MPRYSASVIESAVLEWVLERGLEAIWESIVLSAYFTGDLYHRLTVTVTVTYLSTESVSVDRQDGHGCVC